MRSKNCFFGWMRAESISNLYSFAHELPELIRQYPFAAITSSDGNRGDWLHSAYLAYLAQKPRNPVQYQLIADGILLSGPDVYDMLIEDDFFSGFDEIWFSNQNITKHLPANAILTSESPIIHPNSLDRRTAITGWIVDSVCSLGIADGYRVNYATTSESVALLLERLV